jgi:P-type E1-E2 ATPase
VTHRSRGIRIDVPGWRSLDLRHLILDVNGTLTFHGQLIESVAARIADLRPLLDIRLASADTFGALDSIAASLDVEAVRAESAQSKLDLVEMVGAEHTVVVGNGSNDVAALRAAAVGIAILGPEGLSVAAMEAADVVSRTATDALDLLLEPRSLAATLRS